MAPTMIEPVVMAIAIVAARPPQIGVSNDDSTDHHDPALVPGNRLRISRRALLRLLAVHHNGAWRRLCDALPPATPGSHAVGRDRRGGDAVRARHRLDRIF